MVTDKKGHKTKAEGLIPAYQSFCRGFLLGWPPARLFFFFVSPSLWVPRVFPFFEILDLPVRGGSQGSPPAPSFWALFVGGPGALFMVGPKESKIF